MVKRIVEEKKKLKLGCVNHDRRLFYRVYAKDCFYRAYAKELIRRSDFIEHMRRS